MDRGNTLFDGNVIFIHSIMCWNQNVSMNTFIFSMFVIFLIAYNNNFTQYKTAIFNNNIFVYFFFISFIFMQLIEFFIWRNINDKETNSQFSTLGALLILIQPVASLLMLPESSMKIELISIYSFFALAFFTYQIIDHTFYTIISKSGHLVWKWANVSEYNLIFKIFQEVRYK